MSRAAAHRLDPAPDRLLGALAHRLEASGDLLGGGRRGRHRALGGLGTPGGVQVHLGEDPVHLLEPLLVAAHRGGDGVAGEDGREDLPAEAQLLEALGQDLDHEDAGLAHHLELVREPGADLPADEEGAEPGEGDPKLAHAGRSGGDRGVRGGPGRGGNTSRRDGGRPGGLPGGDQGRNQPVDQDREPHLGEALEPLHHRVEVLGEPGQGLGELLGEPGGGIDLADPLREGVRQALEGLADRGRELRVLGGQLVLLAHQGIDHHVGGQAPFLGHLAQPPDGDIEPVGQGLGQARAVLHHRVEFLAPQHPGGQGLAELQQGRTGPRWPRPRRVAAPGRCSR